MFEAAREHGAALLATRRCPKRSSGPAMGASRARRSRARGSTWLRPRKPSSGACFCRAYARALADRGPRRPTTASLSRPSAIACAIVPGSALNIKITTPLDLKLAAAILPLLEKPRRESSAHPFEDEQAMWGGLPKLKPSDLFGSS